MTHYRLFFKTLASRPLDSAHESRDGAPAPRGNKLSKLSDEEILSYLSLSPQHRNLPTRLFQYLRMDTYAIRSCMKQDNCSDDERCQVKGAIAQIQRVLRKQKNN